MNIKHIVWMTTALLTGTLSSCVEDEGNYDLTPVNEITISDIEDEYNMISYAETLSISPTLEGSLSGTDESQLEYTWFICSGVGTEHTHTVISNERNLSYPLEVPPGSYTIYFQVTDKSTGLQWEKSFALTTLSRFVRGFYLYGDKEDGTVGMDFVSMMDNRDTTVVRDVFVNTLGIKGAQNLIFTGAYTEASTALWAISESGSYSVEYGSSLENFDIREDISAENFIYPTIEVTRPLKVMNIYPNAFGTNNLNMARTNRLLMTENEVFKTSIYNDPEAYGNPISRYSASTSELYKPAQIVFYPGNATYISRVMLYDLTNECFVGLNSSYSLATYTRRYTSDSAMPFYWDQTNYTPVRTFVYGENGFGNGGRSYALMTDADGHYYVYGFVASATPVKQLAEEIDLSIATGFEQASHYAFFSMQSVVLYSVGSQLWGYDYIRKEATMLQDFGAEITYLAMDYHSNNTPTDLIVATYNSAEKGMVRKFTVENDPNRIAMTPHEKEVWNTDLKVVKVEYRNASI